MSSSQTEVANVPRTALTNVLRKLRQVDESWLSACSAFSAFWADLMSN